MLSGLWFVMPMAPIFLSLAALVCGAGAHFWILGRLERAGFQVKYFATVTDNWRAYGTYRRVAGERHWPAWPFYLAVVGTFGGIVGLSVTLIASLTGGIPHSAFEKEATEVSHTPVLLWSLLVAIGMLGFFSHRIFRKLDWQKKALDLKSVQFLVSSNEYLRNDFFGALTGAAGILIVFVLLIWREFGHS